MRKKYKVIIIILMLNFLMFFVSVKGASFDYSRSDSLDTVSISAVSLIEKITQSEASSYDKKFYGDEIYFKYEDKVPSDKVVTSLEGNTLTIHANSYDYTAKNGKSVSWVPLNVKLNDKSYSFEKVNGEYKCIINSVKESDSSIDITYKLSLSLDKDSVNDLLNGAYNEAHYYVSNDIIAKEEEKYKTLYNKYLQDLATYNNYLSAVEKYNSDMLVYKEYLNKLKEYNEALSKYNTYLSELAKYNEEEKAYNDYLYNVSHYDEQLIAYNNYLVDKANYDKEYSDYLTEYETYAKKRKYIDYGLGVMKLIETPMTSMGRTIYNAVMGDAVTQVLEQRDKLYSAGVSKNVIYQAEEATYKLREIFSSYYSLSGEEAKYSYYKSNYSNLKKYMINLLQALEELYGNSIVKGVIDLYDKKPQYVILIAQLVLVCNALNNGTIATYDKKRNFDSGWTIDGKTMNQVLENDYNFTEDDSLAFPIYSYVSAPTAPLPLEEVKKPSQPVEVSKPVKPAEVSKPIEIVQMDAPALPKEVSKPVEPTPYTVDELTNELISGYKSGSLKKRTEYTSDYTMEFEKTLKKTFRNAKEIIVKFYDLDKNLLASYTTDLGSYINYSASLPKKVGDEKYETYKFSHWEYEDGTKLDLNNVTKEGLVYPVFVGEKLRSYKVTWKVNEKVYEESYEYGSIPQFKETIEEKYSGNSYYKFSSWDKVVSEVITDTIYTAVFKKEYIISDDKNHANIKQDEEKVTIDFSSSENDSVDVKKFFDLIVDDDSSFKLEIITKDTTAILSSSTVNNLKNNNVSTIEIVSDMNSTYDYTFEVVFKDENGEVLETKTTVDIEFGGVFNPTKSNLYYEENGELVEVRAEITGNTVKVNNFNPNLKYYVFPTYRIVYESNEYGNVSLVPTARANEEVSINVELLKEGTYVKEIILIDSEGNQTKLESTETFAMPQSDVHVVVTYEYYTYTIEFVVDGETFSSKVYKYGDEVVLPPTPIKASDDEYSYEFVGWSEEVTNCYGDKKYVAIFETTKVVKPQMASGINLVLIGEIVLGCGVIAFMFIFVLKLLKKREE